jgi:hypothetical protein
MSLMKRPRSTVAIFAGSPVTASAPCHLRILGLFMVLPEPTAVAKA